MPTRRPKPLEPAQPPTEKPALASNAAILPRNELTVVGIGASAGGLEALSRFLDALPANPGLAFIVIQHLDPAHESRMVDLLASHTVMPVQQATDGMMLVPDHVFVIPPGVYLAIEAGALRVSEPREHRGSRLPFDFLLQSMAREIGERAIGVVLSGTGADGTKGLAALRAQGGLAIAEDPKEAKFDGMPHSAIAAGAVDLVLPIADIPAALLHRSRRGLFITPVVPAAPLQTEPPGARVVPELANILALLRTRSTHRFNLYKQGTLLRRIERRMGMLGIVEAARYLEVLQEDAKELEQLKKDLLINVTCFFRDPKMFEELATTTLPNLLANHPPDRPLRIWIPACSSGEEVYSLAILFQEAMAAAKRSIKLQIFASDIDQDAVAQAREGLYPASIEADVSPERLARHFTRENGSYRIASDLRAAVVFTVQDLLVDPPFSRLDLISCRNLLIYLQPEAQEKVLLLFHFALREGGILVLGGAETVGSLTSRFEPVSKVYRIFRHIGRNQPGDVTLPLDGRSSPRALWLTGRRMSGRRAPGVVEQAQRLLLDTYAPASVLINGHLTALHFSGPVDRYLRVTAGEPSQDLLGLLREGLRSKLRAVVQQSRSSGSRVEVHGAHVQRDGTTADVRIVVQPLPREGIAGEAVSEPEDLLLVSFFDEPQPSDTQPLVTPTSAAQPTSDTADSLRITELEQELEVTRQDLRNAIHDLEAANEEQKAIDEEAMSVNEEFQSANEELVTSKEELQSLNEELTTLNNQLQESLDRQRDTANDLQNILHSAGVATLFLDRDLNIRFFTPAMTALFKILPGDIGRPLSDLSTLAASKDLALHASAVLAGGSPVQQQIETAEGAWFLRSILPYRTQQQRIEGVVVTFSEITATMLARREVEVAHAYLDSIINTIHQPLVVLDTSHRIVSGNHAFFEGFHVDPVASIGKTFGYPDILSWEAPELPAFLDRVGVQKAPAADLEIWADLPGRGRRWLALHARSIARGLTGATKILLAIDDITEQKAAATELRDALHTADRANQEKSRFLASASHDLRQPLQTIGLLRDLLTQKVTTPEAQELLTRLNDSVTAMTDILNTLLDINQIESGGVRPEIVNFPIGDLLERLKGEFSYHAQATGLDWRVVRCGLTVRSDKRLLEQMIRNLLTNAMKYTSRNPNQTAPGRILLGCRRRADKLLIQVWDNGPGIPKEQISAIFDEFYQVDNPARDRRNGLGLGLSIVRRLSNLLEHPVHVASRIGKGAVFTIEVPLADTQPAGMQAAGRREGEDRVRSILVVEDEPLMRELLEQLLADAGYKTTVAADGLIAVDLVTRGVIRPDLVVADFNLPNRVNGVQTVERLRKLLQAPLPAIVLTGDISAGTRQEIANHHCVHLVKPVNSEALFHTIRQELMGVAEAVAAPPQESTGIAPSAAEAAVTTDGDGIVHVIDDDPALSATLRDLLSHAGYRVALYDSCEAFLEANPDTRAGCVLLDERLPGMSGMDLLRRLQTEGRGPPAIMMTGYGDVKTAVEAMRAGAVDFIEKPAARAALLAAIGRALEQSEDVAKRTEAQQQASHLIASLTPRQHEIMERVLAGQPSKNIAADLNISQRTVENHRALIMKKFGVRSIPELVRVALTGR